MANIIFGGVDLSTYGLRTPEVGGIHDLPVMEVSEQWIPGRAVPSQTDLRRAMRRLDFPRCVVAGTNHTDLVDKLRILKGHLSPERRFCPLGVTDLPGLQIMARSLGFPVKTDSLPYLRRVVEFPLSFAAFPYWEDAEEQTTVVAGLSGSVTNDGDLLTYPAWVCEITNVMPTGLGFTVTGGGRQWTFTYKGALEPGDVLTIKTELPDVILNGSSAFANTDADADYPPLAVGMNTVSKSSTSYTLTAAHRRRHE